MKRSAIIVCVLLAAGPVGAQTPGSEAERWTAPRTPAGRPDLQGIWTTQTFTPLQRPDRFAGKEFLTEEEAAQLTEVLTAPGVDPLRGGAFAQVLAEEDAEKRRETTVQTDPTHYDNAMWLRTTRPKGLSSRRTSLIVDPPDGRIPPRTQEGRQRAAARRDLRGYDSYANRPLQERCLVWGHEGPPMVPPPYNDIYQIFQTPGYVVLFPELANNPARIISTNGQAHLPERVRQWSGDSIGRWDGDTLVVDTTNFTDRIAFQGSGDTLHVVERFTRVDADTILYEFTVDDPATWERSWSVEIPMVKTDGRLYEYTCHEGNYGMRNTLRGARAADRAAAAAARPEPQ